MVKKKKSSGIANIPVGVLESIDILLKSYNVDFRKLIQENKKTVKDDCWLSLQNAADYAKVSRWTVRRWLTRGVVIGSKTSIARCGRILVNKASLESHLASLRIENLEPSHEK